MVNMGAIPSSELKAGLQFGSFDTSLDTVGVIVGSGSDFGKIEKLLKGLNGDKVAYVLSALSAHRTPGELEAVIASMPTVNIPESLDLDDETRVLYGKNNVNVKLILAAAGISAHLAGVIASQTQIPVIAYPVESSTAGQVDSTFSMVDMPPGIPNGFTMNQEVAQSMIQKIITLTEEEAQLIFIEEALLDDKTIGLLVELGIKYTTDPSESSIGIHTKSLTAGDEHTYKDSKIPIVIPTQEEAMNLANIGNRGEEGNRLEALSVVEGASMGLNNDGKENTKNAILFCAQIMGIFDKKLVKRLAEYRSANAHDVVEANDELLLAQLSNHLAPIHEAIKNGIWPRDKEITGERGLDALENLGYKLFYKGKNADLYTIPGQPNNILMFRTDRTSVYDIPLDLEIEGKGAIQNQIGISGAKFAEVHGIDIANVEIPQDIPDDILDRCQAIKLGKILSIEINGKDVGLELIYRDRLTGSLWKAYKAGEDPYNLNLPEGLQEFHKFEKPVFTPTTKEKTGDEALDPELVRKEYPEIVQKLQGLFEDFCEYAYGKGYVLIDTKFEVFRDPETGKWFLGDEILTPESSRFISVKNFEAGDMISADKQIIRDLGKQFGWEERWEALKAENEDATFLSVASDITQGNKQQVLDGYQNIHDALK